MERLRRILISLLLLILVSCVSKEPGFDVSSEGQSDIDKVTATKIPDIDGLNLMWENKDAIALRYQENRESTPVSCRYSTSLAASKETAVFKKESSNTKTPNKIDGKYVAIYPASLNNATWAKDSYAMLSANSEQTVKNKKIDRSSVVMIAACENAELTFHHVVAYVKFTVKDESTPFNKVTVTSGDLSQNMVSQIKVNFDDDFSYSLETSDDSGYINSRHVTFSTSDGSNFSAGTYLIAINPDSYNKGIRLTFENAFECSVTKEYPGPYVIEPGEVIDTGEVGELDFNISLSHISVYKKNGRKLGIVFQVDPDDPDKRKVVSADSKLVQWATANEKWRINGSKEDYDYVHAIVTSSDRYIDNPDGFPAVKFCDQMRRNHGGNWHVPSLGELNMLFNAYYGKESDAAVSTDLEYTDSNSTLAARYFDSLLESAGGEKMLAQSNEYWTCGQNSNANMQYVNMSRYNNGSDSQLAPRYVRCVRDVDDSISDKTIVYPQTNIGQLFKGDMSSRIVDVVWDTTYNVTNGLDYYQMQVITDAQEKLDVYLLRCDPSKGLEIKATISTKTTGTTWHLQNLIDMAAGINSATNPVYAIINADFSDKRSPIRPRGPVHSNGRVWCSTFSLDPDYTHQGLSYVGMTYEGKMKIGERENYESAMTSLKECTGGGVILLEDSKIVGRGSTSRDPRTAVGYTSNNVIWMLAVDGRHKGTEGMTYSEMSTIFFDIGCEAAVNLDGGGSTQMLTRNSLTGALEMRNWPSDPTDGEGGEPRPRLTGWAIVKK